MLTAPFHAPLLYALALSYMPSDAADRLYPLAGQTADQCVQQCMNEGYQRCQCSGWCHCGPVPKNPKDPSQTLY